MRTIRPGTCFRRSSTWPVEPTSARCGSPTGACTRWASRHRRGMVANVGVNSRQPVLLLRSLQERRLERVARQRGELRLGEPEPALVGYEILQQVAAEVSRII